MPSRKGKMRRVGAVLGQRKQPTPDLSSFSGTPTINQNAQRIFDKSRALEHGQTMPKKPAKPRRRR